ncbi:MAG: glycosyltransferase family 2 protein [Armatimonadota bacterium]
MNKISALILTYNSEKHISRCINSITFADEILVLDSFSNDKTIEIAKELGARVEQREFNGFSQQRSESLKLAVNDWVFVIDADECASKELAKEIANLENTNEITSYLVPRLTWFLDKPIRRCGWYPDYSPRLFRKSKAHYPDRLVHESVEIEGKSAKLACDIHHYSYQSIDDFSRKVVLYAKAAAKQRFAEGKKFKISDILIKPTVCFIKMYVLKKGFLDGIHGLMLSLLSSFSIMLRYAYLWEMSRNKKTEKLE